MVFYLALAFGVRVGVALRTTGKSGLPSLRSAPPIELFGGALFTAGVVLGGANPALALAETIPVWEELDTFAAHAAGLVLCAVGIAGTFAAQMAMGTSWRIGVDYEERTELVTGGLFGLCRNPIYTFMMIAWVGFALLVPTWISDLHLKVPSPPMIRTHGETYLAWARGVGRFLPGLGRLA